MIRAVAKSRYLKGLNATAKAKAHINYIGYRPGEDRERGGREFFSQDRDGIKGSEVYAELDRQDERSVICHKLILSPGVDNPDMQAYTRETMEKLEKEKGLELNWYAVEHKNTSHTHAHVVIMGKSKDGHQVRIDRDDLKFIRDQGDRYLEREHTYDRYMDREIDRLLKEPMRERELKYERAHGDREYERLFGESDKKKRRGHDIERDRQEWELFDNSLHKQFDNPNRDREWSKGFDRWNLEQSGKLADFHERQTMQDAKGRLSEQLRNEDAVIAEAAAHQLADIERIEADRMGQFKDLDIDKLIDGKSRDDRDFDRLLEREFKEFDKELNELKMSGKDQYDQFGGLNLLNLFKQDMDQGAEQIFEADREQKVFREKEDERDRGDLDRGDDMLER